jgi:hypothetical protein
VAIFGRKHNQNMPAADCAFAAANDEECGPTLVMEKTTVIKVLGKSVPVYNCHCMVKTCFAECDVKEHAIIAHYQIATVFDPNATT